MSRWTSGVVALALLALAALVAARTTSALDDADGRAVYTDACAACHGADGRGRPGAAFDVPLPDFTDCRVVTAEPDSNWLALIEHGGADFGLSSAMPAFSGALTRDQEHAVLEYVRSFCTDPSWPRGDLNFPQPVFVGKAFPEDELILSPSFVDASDAREIGGQLSYERRVGARGGLELAVPALLNDVKHGGPTAGGLGDVALAYKQVIYAGLAPRAIASLASDLVLPTGEPTKGTGDGTVTFEPALLAGTELGGVILQTEIRSVLPVDVDRAARVLLYRFALQAPLGPMRRSLVPALEFESAQKLAGSFRDYTALGPTFYVPLSKRGHVAFGAGGQVVVSAAHPFDYRIGAFVLWDYLDGPLW